MSLLTQAKGTQAPLPLDPIVMAPCTLFRKKTPHLPKPVIFLRNLPLHSEKEALRPWGAEITGHDSGETAGGGCHALHWGPSSPGKYIRGVCDFGHLHPEQALEGDTKQEHPTSALMPVCVIDRQPLGQVATGVGPLDHALSVH